MSARSRSYQRVSQAEVAALSTPAGSEVSAHVGSSFDDDESDGDAPSDDHDLLPHDGGDDDDDDDGHDHSSDALKKKKKRRQQRRRSQAAAACSAKLHALVWIAAAASAAYGVDVFHVVAADPRVRRGYLRFGLVCAGVNACITLYLAVYLPYVRRIHLEWSVYCPRMIPTATVVGALATLAFVAAFWPVWGLFTPGLLALFFIGALMTAHFLPPI